MCVRVCACVRVYVCCARECAHVYEGAVDVRRQPANAVSVRKRALVRYTEHPTACVRIAVAFDTFI